MPIFRDLAIFVSMTTTTTTMMTELIILPLEHACGVIILCTLLTVMWYGVWVVCMKIINFSTKFVKSLQHKIFAIAICLTIIDALNNYYIM